MGTVFLGKYQVPNTYIAALMVNTDIEVTGFECQYDRTVLMLHYYPVGCLDCSCCNRRNVVINSQQPAYAVYSHNRGDIDYHYSKLTYKTLICSQCYNSMDAFIRRQNYSCKFRINYGSPHYCRILAQRDTDFNTRCVFRRWKKKAHEQSIRKKALETLRQPIMHWANRPGGPLYRLTLGKYTQTLNAMT
jgi:hypothetical protein